jgi:hypothetical protein
MTRDFTAQELADDKYPGKDLLWAIGTYPDQLLVARRIHNQFAHRLSGVDALQNVKKSIMRPIPEAESPIPISHCRISSEIIRRDVDITDELPSTVTVRFEIVEYHFDCDRIFAKLSDQGLFIIPGGSRKQGRLGDKGGLLSTFFTAYESGLSAAATDLKP